MVFSRHGVQSILGLDGGWVSRDLLKIPASCFKEFDLSKPYADSKRFDLAICLEVAEHLPVNAADAIVESLTRLAPVVLFSAAIPHQGGVNHINEQWLDYWRDVEPQPIPGEVPEIGVVDQPDCPVVDGVPPKQCAGGQDHEDGGMAGMPPPDENRRDDRARGEQRAQYLSPHDPVEGG